MTISINTDPLMNTQEAARYIGLTTSTLQFGRTWNKGPRYLAYSHRAVRYRQSDLDVWMAQHQVETRDARKPA